MRRKKSVTATGDEGAVCSLSQEGWHRGRVNWEEGSLCVGKSGRRIGGNDAWFRNLKLY